MKYKMTVTRCDVCGKTDAHDDIDFVEGDWYIERDIDICENCYEAGEIGHELDIKGSTAFTVDQSQTRHIKDEWYYVPNSAINHV